MTYITVRIVENGSNKVLEDRSFDSRQEAARFLAPPIAIADEIDRLRAGWIEADRIALEARKKDYILLDNLTDAAAKFRDSFDYDPGQYDLDDEQPITIFVTLGDWRRLNMLLPQSKEHQ